MNWKEFSLGGLLSLIATIVTLWLGGWDLALKALVVLMVIDYVTGVLGAIKNKNVSSEIMFWGGLRKGLILVVVVIAVLLDGMVGNSEPIFRTLALYFYVAREGISITENLGILGVPLPPAISQMFIKLQEKESGGSGKEGTL